MRKRRKTGKSGKPQTVAKSIIQPAHAVLLALLIAAVGFGFWFGLGPSTASPHGHYTPRPHGAVNFNKDIAPITLEHCAGCHRPGQSGPFNLITYSEVKKRARQVAEVTGSRVMPPWLPEDGHEEFLDSRRLTPQQIGLINQWASEGAPEGRSSDLPPRPKWTDGWQLGPPDLVVTLPEAYTLSKEGKDIYRNFVIPLPTTERRYVRAFEFRPSSKAVHHAFIRIDGSGRCRELDEHDAGIGFGGMQVPPTEETPAGHFLSWQPGRQASHSPKGLEWTLPGGADLVMLLHMQPRGKPERIQPSIGFYFTAVPPTNEPVKIGLAAYNIDIPAGATNYLVEERFTLPVETELLALLPHTHYLGKRLESFATLPDGTRKTLLAIPEWDFNWQSDFRFANPVILPKGTTLAMRYTFDNSAGNFRNPSVPPVRVRYGMQTTNEMAEIYFQVLPHHAEDKRELWNAANRQVLRNAMDLSQTHLRENPADTFAMVQLGKFLLMGGDLGRAEPFFRRAIALQPAYSDAHYCIGTLLFERKLYPEAEAEFLEAARLDPQDYRARNNAGLCCLRQRKWDEAASHFMEVLRLNPGDKLAQGNLDIVAQARRTAAK
jgi:Flp pilus assembly protein TadD